MRQIFFGMLTGVFLASAVPASAQSTPQVAVTIKPIHALAAGVMEGIGTPELLMEGMASPHSYQLRPSEAAMLVSADLVIWVGPGVESTFPETIGMLPSSVRLIELAGWEGIATLPLRESGIRRGGDSRSSDTYEHYDIDPHIWLDPANAMAISRIIADELSALDPANAERYHINAANQIERLQVLEVEIRTMLSPVSEVAFVTFHDAYQYFERAFGLNAIAAIAISPDRMPGARTIMELRYAIMDEGVVCVFAEPQFAPRLVNTLIEGSGAKAGTLDPLGEGVTAGSSAFEEIMRGLARDAVACLENQEGGG